MSFWDDIKHFTVGEFTCHCGCGRSDMDEDFMLCLDDLREQLGFPLGVSSGFRCPDHNDKVSSTGRNGPHTTGKAADLLVFGAEGYAVVSQAADSGMSGVGISQASKTPHGERFVHVDTLGQAVNRPRPWIWSY